MGIQTHKTNFQKIKQYKIIGQFFMQLNKDIGNNLRCLIVSIFFVFDLLKLLYTF